MKIILVHQWYPHLGGTEKCVANLALEYTALGHAVCIVTSKPVNEADGQLAFIPGKKFLRYQVPQRQPFLQFLRDWKPDVVHVNSPHPYATVAGAYAKLAGFCTVSTYHGPLNPPQLAIRIAARLEHQLYQFAFRRIIATTERNKEIISKFYPAARIQVIPLGIDRHFFEVQVTRAEARASLHLNINDKIVLFVGQMDVNHYYKGVPELLQCAKRTPTHKYVLIGSGDKRDEYRALAESLQLSNVTFLMGIKDADLIKYYHAADVLVLPSTSSSEGYGIVLLEAMSCGTPVITTDVTGSAKELSKHRAGLVVAAGSPTALQEGVEKITGAMALRGELIQNGLALVRNRNWQSIARQTVQAYAEAIGQR